MYLVLWAILIGLSALLVSQVLSKSNFGPSIFFSLKLGPKQFIRSTYHLDNDFDHFFYVFMPRWKVSKEFYQGRFI
jgi:hypothetical protein